ncbi:hypothetical protein A5641_07265 [Mycobacterium sp. 1554424.7]|nr:hypothetical protein A5641_07265 [Mycobacterium sp. 1554424.7]
MVPIDEDMLSKVLEPYSYKGCRYLIDAGYKASPDSIVAYGNFSIAESAYVRSTGHFTAAELILCFNQLAYSAFAAAIRNEEIHVFRGWSTADYFQNQLTGMLIKTVTSRFSWPINPQSFAARLWCNDFRIIYGKLRYLQFSCTTEFWDADGGSASSEIELAALNTP